MIVYGALLVVGGALLLMGSRAALAYADGKPLGYVQLIEVDGIPVERQTGLQFLAMQKAARLAGVRLTLTSGFRTMEDQIRLYARYLAGGDLAAKPGYSNHQQGLALDISVGRSFTSREYLWLKANALRYGFKNPGEHFSQPEPWHWERVKVVQLVA